MAAWEAIGTLLTNVDVFGFGMAITIFVLLVGITRGMTNKADSWALILSSLAWLLALTLPNTTFAGICFITGAMSITYTFTPLMKQLETSNIFVIASVAFMINLLLVAGANTYNTSMGWSTNLADAQSDILSIIGTETTTAEGGIISTGLCTPAQEASGECESAMQSGVINTLLFDIIGSALAIGTYIGKAVKFAGMAMFAPLVISSTIATMVNNVIILYLITIYITLWNMLILYKTIMFVLGNRGK